MGFPYLRNPCLRNPCFRNSHLRNPCFRNSHLRNFSPIQAPLNQTPLRLPPIQGGDFWPLLLWVGKGAWRVLVGNSFGADKDLFRVFGEGVKSASGAIAILAAATTLETCLQRPFTRTIANELLHSKQQKECNSFSTIANYCVA